MFARSGMLAVSQYIQMVKYMQSFRKELRVLSVDLKDFYDPLLNGKSKVQKIGYDIVVRKNMEKVCLCVF